MTFPGTSVLDYIPACQHQHIANGDIEAQRDLSEYLNPIFDSDFAAIYFPPGKYRIDSTLVVRRPKTLVGCGMHASQILYTGTGIAMRVGFLDCDRENGPKSSPEDSPEKVPVTAHQFVSNWGGFSMSGLDLFGSDPDGKLGNIAANGGLHLTNIGSVVVRDVTIGNFGDDSFNGNNDAFGVLGDRVVTMTMERVVCSSCGVGIDTTLRKSALKPNGEPYGLDNTNWSIQNCKFYANKYGCILRSLKGSGFFASTFEQNRRNGLNIQTQEVYGVSFYSCWSEANGRKVETIRVWSIFDGLDRTAVA